MTARIQRHELLIKASQIPVTFTGPGHCHVESGRWYDPYTGRTFTQASDLHIDHIVSLKYAHTHSAANWPTERKEQFANDWINIIPVEAGINRKGAKGPSEWLPPNKPYRCTFLQRFDSIMKTYNLVYRPPEARTMQRLLAGCTEN